MVCNRWARWAAKKYYKAPEQVDIQEYEQLLPSDESIEEDFIHSQELAQVRRELAFIRSDYRQILVAHYFEEMSVSEANNNPSTVEELSMELGIAMPYMEEEVEIQGTDSC